MHGHDCALLMQPKHVRSSSNGLFLYFLSFSFFLGARELSVVEWCRSHYRVCLLFLDFSAITRVCLVEPAAWSNHIFIFHKGKGQLLGLSLEYQLVRGATSLFYQYHFILNACRMSGSEISACMCIFSLHQWSSNLVFSETHKNVSSNSKRVTCAPPHQRLSGVSDELCRYVWCTLSHSDRISVMCMIYSGLLLLG